MDTLTPQPVSCVVVRTLLVVLLCATFVPHVDAQTCPTQPPAAHLAAIHPGRCQQSCDAGQKISFELLPQHLAPPPALALPPLQPPPGYRVQSCDELTWNFGDGSPSEVRTGRHNAGHIYTAPGNYRVRVMVSNSLGSAQFSIDIIVGPQAHISVPAIEVSEGAGQLTIPLERSGDTTHRVSLDLRITGDPSIAPALGTQTVPVVFEPGVTAQNVILPLHDNQLFDGRRILFMSGENLQGGITAGRNGIELNDNDPQPILTAGDVLAREGDHGVTEASVPVQLSAPMGQELVVHGHFASATEEQGNDDIFGIEIAVIPAGQTSGHLRPLIAADTTPELDEVVRLTLFPFRDYRRAPLVGPQTNIVIVNDDAALTPPLHTGDAGQQVGFTLYPGGHFDAPKVVNVRTIPAGVLAAPQTLTIPVGAATIPFDVTLASEGSAAVEIDLGDRIARAELRVQQPRVLAGAPQALTMTVNGTTRVTLSLSPANDVPVTLHLSADSEIVTIPRAVTVPAGGEATFEIQAVGKGATAVGVTPLSEAIGGLAIPIDVLPAKRRAAR